MRENGQMPEEKEVDSAVSTELPSPSPSTSQGTADASTDSATDSAAASDEPQKTVVTAAQAKRLSSSAWGMIFSILVTLAVVIPVILLNPPSNKNVYENRVDVPAIAQQVVEDLNFKAAAPKLPQGWYANFARWNAGGTEGVPAWEVGYVTPTDGFIWLRQTKNANPTWISQVTKNAPVSGQRTVGSTVWEMRETDKETTYVAKDVHGYTIVLSGPASLEDLDAFAFAVQDSLSS